MIIFEAYQQDFQSLEKRAAKVRELPVIAQDRSKILANILGLLDMTTLEGTDYQDKIVELCRQSRFSSSNPELSDAAAVCVYPNFVSLARKQLDDSEIKVASVAGAFPSGQTSLRVKLQEIKYAIDEGADEIDTVINRGKVLAGEYEEVFDELAAIRETAGHKHLKVILETAELGSVQLIRKASELAIATGADFIKTSTGKSSAGATPEGMLIMLDTIREFAEKTGKAIGVKPAGGIREPETAVYFYKMVDSVLGSQWLKKDLFRFGASSLAGKILLEL